VSKTAIWVAAARAVGAREPDSRARNPDHLAEPLLGNTTELDFDHPVLAALSVSYDEAMQDLEVAGSVRAMTERTRFIDQALERAIAEGAAQVLIPGAGFDSHAYRYSDLLARARVFEVDRPATLAFKKRRVDAALGGPPLNLTYVPLELERNDLPEALSRHGYDPAQRTFVIMEGLTMYLSETALRAVFRFVASHPPGSRMVFDFATRPVIEGLGRIDLATLPPAARPSLERFLDMTRREPWVFGFPVDGEQQWVAELGLQLREVLTLGSDESVARYLTRADGTIVGAEAQAKAERLRKAAHEKAAERLGPELRRTIEESMREQQRQTAYRIAEAVVD
jgi:methyltransferase (TIGR00027 family)